MRHYSGNVYRNLLQISLSLTAATATAATQCWIAAPTHMLDTINRERQRQRLYYENREWKRTDQVVVNNNEKERKKEEVEEKNGKKLQEKEAGNGK